MNARQTAAIDLSYKDNAMKCEYDIESLESIFSIVFMHDKAVTLVFFGDESYDTITNEELRNVAINFMQGEKTLETFPGITDASQLDYHIVRAYTGDEESIFDLYKLLVRFITCKPLPTDDQYNFGFVEYCGWNSARYDLPLMIIVKELIERMGKKVRPADIRRASDIIIHYEGSPWGFPYELARGTKGWGNITDSAYRLMLNIALYSDGHIDWASTAKLGDEGAEQKFPPGLKKEMARFGMNIVIDDLVGGEQGKTIDRQDVLDLMYYNCNDVLGTRIIGQNVRLRSKLQAHDNLNKMYPYTSAKSVPFDKLSRISPLARDCTEASLSGTILIGPRRIRPIDSETIQYDFPVPDNREGAKDDTTRSVDLLEYMKETEDFMHPLIYQFFDYFRGKDTRSSYDNFMVSKNQPITGSAMMNCPYYRDGKPVDSFVRLSTGGAHGSIMTGLRNMSESQIEEWVRSDRGALDSESPTLDLDDVAHLDWSSFYPQLATRMELYKTAEGVDRYTDIIRERFRIKEALPFDKSQWGPDDYKLDQDQDALKVVLNAVTGAGNTHNPRALIPLDNKTMSMRLMGNMHIWCLGQRLTQAGGLVIATNTDGLYMVGLSNDEIDKVVEGYVHDYGMPVEPEYVDRFINRDTSNRIEMLEGRVREVRGRLRHGVQPTYTDDAIGKNVPYPLAAAHAVIRYISEDRDWLTKDYDRERLVQYIQDIYETNGDNVEPWYQIHVGSGSMRLTVDGVRKEKINRVVMTKPEVGSYLATERSAELRKAEAQEFWNRRANNESLTQIAEEMGLIWTEETEGLDFSTLRFCRKVDDPELGKKKPESVNVQWPGEFANDAEFNDYWKQNGIACLAALPKNAERDAEYVPLKVWRESSLTNYTSNYGRVLNSVEELNSFSLEDLDLDAYVRWSENLLDGWKKTADFPDIGLTARDDTVVVKKTGKKRVTKKQRAIDLVHWLYTAADKEAA